MEADFSLLIKLAETEFDGDCLNGKSFMATLEALSAEQAASNATFEGYTVWSIALHVAWCEWVVAKAFLSGAELEALGPYPYPEGVGGFFDPPAIDEAAWQSTRACLRRIHRFAMDAIAAHGRERFDEVLPEWKMPKGEAAVWLCGHATYHAAQIRSMGLEGFRSRRVY
jgi:hypothetical protein